MKAWHRVAAGMTVPGWIGLALLFAAVLFEAGQAAALRDQNARAEVDIEQQRQRVRRAAQHLQAPDAGQQLQAFVATLPGSREVNQLLNTVHETAASHQLAIKHSEYRAVQTAGSELAHLQIHIKSAGSYAKLRGFMRELPQALPFVAFKQLALTRQRIGEAQLDVTAELHLFYVQE